MCLYIRNATYTQSIIHFANLSVSLSVLVLLFLCMLHRFTCTTLSYCLYYMWDLLEAVMSALRPVLLPLQPLCMPYYQVAASRSTRALELTWYTENSWATCLGGCTMKWIKHLLSCAEWRILHKFYQGSPTSTVAYYAIFLYYALIVRMLQWLAISSPLWWASTFLHTQRGRGRKK